MTPQEKPFDIDAMLLGAKPQREIIAVRVSHVMVVAPKDKAVEYLAALRVLLANFASIDPSRFEQVAVPPVHPNFHPRTLWVLDFDTVPMQFGVKLAGADVPYIEVFDQRQPGQRAELANRLEFHLRASAAQQFGAEADIIAGQVRPVRCFDHTEVRLA